MIYRLFNLRKFHAIAPATNTIAGKMPIRTGGSLDPCWRVSVSVNNTEASVDCSLATTLVAWGIWVLTGVAIAAEA